MKRILFFVCLAAIACSCNKLSLPEDWKEVNAKALENASFKAVVGDIDPEQVWNVANGYGYTDTLIVTEVIKSQASPADFSANTKASGNTVVGIEADSYRLYEMGQTYAGFELALFGCSGDAEYTLGICYTNTSGVQIEQPLWSNFTCTTYKSMYEQFVTAVNNTVFSFYLEATKNVAGTPVTKKFYSECARNTENDLPHNLFDAQIIGMPPYFIHFEDGWGDHDYEEVTVKITDTYVIPNKVQPLDYDKGPWMLICEDYGSDCDNDFNDVVIVVKRPNATTVNLELVAAGAVRNNVVYVGSKKLGEVHELFGVSQETMVNTYNGTQSIGKTAEVPSYKTTLTVTKDWTMSSADMGGFRITSQGEEGASFDITKKGTAPYMIVLPANDFSWPVEQISIFEAYPKFESWAKDHTVNKDWYMYPVEGKVYKKSVTY